MLDNGISIVETRTLKMRIFIRGFPSSDSILNIGNVEFLKHVVIPLCDRHVSSI